MYRFDYEEDDKRRWKRLVDETIGTQLIVNYCFSHPETSLMLCPYGSGVNYINHHSERSKRNVKIRWPTSSSFMMNQTWLDELRPEDMHGTLPMSLAFDYVATRDIAVGDELVRVRERARVD